MKPPRHDTSPHESVRHRGLKKPIPLALTALVAIAIGQASASSVEEDPPPLPPTSLKQVPVPMPVNLDEFVKDKEAAIALGKALFWDMQVGSDGTQACASCHFHAGADDRSKNSVSPGLLAADSSFQLATPNGRLNSGHFPLTKFMHPDQPGVERDAANILLRNFNDVISSQGISLHTFKGEIAGDSVERATLLQDPVFNVANTNVRRVEPRNSPSVLNAVFNFSNFWDGRARNIFNWVNPFGELDEDARVFVNGPSGLLATQVRIPDASLASQATGPVLSDFEMSSQGRVFPKVAKKLLSLKPLAKQVVHPGDSVLGNLASLERKGLNTTYAAMIRAAFHDKWWNDSEMLVKFEVQTRVLHVPERNDPRTYPVGNGKPMILPRTRSELKSEEFSQMEANFSLFFGLAVQLYESTLVSDDSKFDRVRDGLAQFSPDEEEGFKIFMNQGKCINCHGGAEFTNHSVTNVRQGRIPEPPGYVPNNFIEIMDLNTRSNVAYDNGFYNIGVRPGGSNDPNSPGFVKNNEDLGRGATAPLINPMTEEPYPLSAVELAKLKARNLLPPGVAQFVPDLPAALPSETEVAADGSLKAPSLRNIELTGPYFRNGDAATLMQVVQFYARGGNFPVTNQFNLDADIHPIGHLIGSPERQRQLVAFLLTLTDERVRQEMAPFDHPQLHIPDGSKGNETQLECEGLPDPDLSSPFCDELIEIPAVGAAGRPAESLPPLRPFLNLDPMAP